MYLVPAASGPFGDCHAYHRDPRMIEYLECQQLPDLSAIVTSYILGRQATTHSVPAASGPFGDCHSRHRNSLPTNALRPAIRAVRPRATFNCVTWPLFGPSDLHKAFHCKQLQPVREVPGVFAPPEVSQKSPA